MEDCCSGLLVLTDRPHDTVRAIIEIATDDTLAQKLLHGARLRAQQFSLDAMIDRTSALYDTLLASR